MKSRMMLMMAAGAIMAFRGVLAADIPANSSRLTYAENPDGTLMVTGVESGGIDEGKLIIPESHDGKTITMLKFGAFANKSEIFSVQLPTTIVSVSSFVFANCTNLSDIEIPDSIIEICSYAFYGCTGLASVDFPSSLETIDSNAFQGSGLKSLTLPDSVVSIGIYAFDYCLYLTNAVLPKSVKVIPEHLFSDCQSLVSVVLPSTCEVIGKMAFGSSQNKGTALETIVIPASCTNIENLAFCSSTNLNVYFEGDAPKTGSFVFTSNKTTLYVKPEANGFGPVPGVWNGYPTEVWGEAYQLLITAFAVEGEKMNFTVRLVDEQGGQNIPDAGRKVRLLGAGLLTEEFEECSEPIALDANGSFEANLPEGKTTFFFKVALVTAE